VIDDKQLNALLKEWVKPIERMLDYKPPGWAWPAIMVVLAGGAFGMSHVFAPVTDTVVAFWNTPMPPGTCSFIELTGWPCPSCGMTRSWIHSARGNVVTGFLFNPAGALLFWWLMVGGVLGTVRLATRNYTKWKVPSNVLAAWAVFWMVGPYGIVWMLRIWAGINPLP